jgi:hypothetical protein
MARVAAFTVLGVVLAPLLLRRMGLIRTSVPSSRPFVIAATCLLLADVALKTLLAPTWGRVLRDVLPN